MEVTQFPEVSYKNEFELVAFRHRFFTNADKTTSEYIKTHSSTIKYQAAQFYQKKQQMCAIAGYELEDIISYCRVWCVNLFGKLFKDALQKPIIEQERILRYYLKQELSRFALLLFKKGQSTMVDYLSPDFCYNYEIETHIEDTDWSEQVSKLPHGVFLKKISYVLSNSKAESSLKDLAIQLLTNHKMGCRTCKRAIKKFSN